ncbi:ATP-binding cassette domain-containing protein [Crenobacter sp. SG2303]|uniref:ATP-binding cassette domain-containing protein n=1 Tax=Crenobacter oryzisoli TaxID=3056844 RepID=A0ABT7XR39_9NEIS|nr:ATP-binding cassette domain-containing protein [Crenobacter sp. SG2303]MDN0076029.1 ATP-binding cassette domain-containing protein [Crenobacter sp. SG2303]
MQQATKPGGHAIETTGLTRRFGTLTAVDHIDLTVEYGGIFGLLGPNGAGKSTLIKMLTTLLKPSEGTARVAGFDIVAAPAEVRRRIGYVPQLLSADGALSGIENLTLSARLYGLSGAALKPRIDEALRYMGLADAAEQLVKRYSGGMIRRLELAQAMLHRPAILFLDEPTIGLDPVACLSVWDRLRALNREHGMTILMTSHFMDEVDELCDVVAILHQGRMAACGSPAQLKAVVGEAASMTDVFTHFSGGRLDEDEGGFRDIRRTRITAKRLG